MMQDAWRNLQSNECWKPSFRQRRHVHSERHSSTVATLSERRPRCMSAGGMPSGAGRHAGPPTVVGLRTSISLITRPIRAGTAGLPGRLALPHRRQQRRPMPLSNALGHPAFPPGHCCSFVTLGQRRQAGPTETPEPNRSRSGDRRTWQGRRIRRFGYCCELPWWAADGAVWDQPSGSIGPTCAKTEVGHGAALNEVIGLAFDQHSRERQCTYPRQGCLFATDAVLALAL